MKIQKLIGILNEKAKKLGPDAEVRIERIFDRFRDDNYGLVFGLAVGAKREQAKGYEAGALNSADRVKELDRYIEFGYLG